MTASRAPSTTKATTPVNPSRTVVLGLDGGGSTVRAVALIDEQVVFRGSGGPGNPLSTDEDTLAVSYTRALDGCPTPHLVGACVAGAGGPIGQQRLTDLFGSLLPTVPLVVGADYLAPIYAAPDHDVWVICGTGSLVASRGAEKVVSSGGRGWILGDRGSASRLGRGVLEHYVEDTNAEPDLATDIAAVAGDDRWQALFSALQACAAPGAWHAQFASLATGRAERGLDWACRLIETEMGALAATTARHVSEQGLNRSGLSVCLVGGVWNGKAVRATYERALITALATDPIFEVPAIDLAVGAAAYAVAATEAAP